MPSTTNPLLCGECGVVVMVMVMVSKMDVSAEQIQPAAALASQQQALLRASGADVGTDVATRKC